MKSFFHSLFMRPAHELSEEEAIGALRVAIERDDLPTIKEILTKFPSLLNYSDEQGETPLHWAARAEKISSVGCLVDLGADTKKKTNVGRTPADYASNEIRMGALTDLCRMIHERIDAGPLK